MMPSGSKVPAGQECDRRGEKAGQGFNLSTQSIRQSPPSMMEPICYQTVRHTTLSTGRTEISLYQGPTGPERTDWPARDRLQSQTVRSPILSWLVASQHPYLPLIPPPPAAIIILSLPSVLFRVRRQRGRESSSSACLFFFPFQRSSSRNIPPLPHPSLTEA
ncbi:uncharacterized protein BO87DRAFT_15988 [Aspergillus neoniger CBS 115656]|uniref:Uncharacterized protein n=1 Tax=Aspergillus neoniger (strain CBS 115656) TaxID=1448310 RepID=A0A318ZJ17_ASPNB|nr:hypothetical protein BO87DRAFT_15988 [Aspergillus neoniger CBS 115656]PYH36042.1 hypothetical protein BO87DRAFT_15988 [Aspergillus neoniger CBS 115656]